MSDTNSVWKIISLSDSQAQYYFELSKESKESKRINKTKDKCVLSFSLDDLPENMRNDLYRSCLYAENDEFMQNLPVIQTELDKEEWTFYFEPTAMQSFYNALPSPIKSFFSYIGSFFNG